MRRRSSHEEEERNERHEAIAEIDGDPALLDTADEARGALGSSRDRFVDHAPEMILDAHVIARLPVEGRRQLAMHAKEGLEHLPDRLAEALGGVLHARGLAREAAVPWRRAAQASVIEASHRPDR